MKTIGIIVLALGILMTVFTGFSYVTKEKVVDVGPLEINKEEHHPVYWSPITGIVLVVAGIGVIALSGRKKIV